MPIKVLRFERKRKSNGTTEDWVEYASDRAVTETGVVNSSTWSPIRRLKPPAEYGDNVPDEGKIAALSGQWAQIGPAYEAWLQGNSLDVQGTALDTWAALGKDETRALKAIGIATVEQIANMSEDQLMRPPLPDMRRIHEAAKAFLKGMPLADLQAEIQRLREQNEAMLAMLAEKTEPEPDEADEATGEPKRGPGRPRKDAA